MGKYKAKEIKYVGTHAISARVPHDLYVMFKTLCIENGISINEGIVQYLRYLKSHHKSIREVHNESTVSDFELDGRKSP
jgi:hypothetical protein